MSNICTRPRAPDVVPVYVWRWTVLEGNLGKDTATVKSKERASYCRIRKAARIAARHTVCLPCGWQMSFAADPAAVSHQGRIFLFIYFFVESGNFIGPCREIFSSLYLIFCGKLFCSAGIDC